ncbi:MAG: AmmeMemoRadiSam system radical SAM enzyme [Planctomycetota bacterium]
MEALYYKKLCDNKVECTLCPNACVIAEGLPGRCLGRVNREGTLIAVTFERPASIAVDPIEKKPLYHFVPGSNILSLGTYGCNLNCSFCQNWSLSQQQNPTDELTAENAVRLAKGRDSIGIAYTYNEPTIWFEYVLECSKEIKKSSLKNALVTNGYINPEPLAELLPYIDAMNIDLKSFRDDFYQEICGGSLAPVLHTIETSAENCHVEITNLVIPGINDSVEEQNKMGKWIAENCGEETPLHISAYYPRYNLKAEQTTADDLMRSREVFKKYLKFVYLGNIQTDNENNTLCTSCGETVIKRNGYTIELESITDSGDCAKCGCKLNIVK